VKKFKTTKIAKESTPMLKRKISVSKRKTSFQALKPENAVTKEIAKVE